MLLDMPKIEDKIIFFLEFSFFILGGKEEKENKERTWNKVQSSSLV